MSPKNDCRNECLINVAISHIIDGRKDKARFVLTNLLIVDRNNVDVWRLLAVCVNTETQIQYCKNRTKRIQYLKIQSKEDLVVKGVQTEVATNCADINHSQNHLPQPLNSETDGKQVHRRRIDSTKEKIFKESRKSYNIKIGDKESVSKNRKINNVKHNFKKPTFLRFPDPDENLFFESKFTPKEFPQTDSGMFGLSLLTGGVKITYDDCPKCIQLNDLLDKSNCENCSFFAYSDCPLIDDPDVINVVNFFYSQHFENYSRYKKRRNSVIKAIYVELKKHGRPLHYEILAKMIHNRYPNLELNPKRILHHMIHHPDKFENISQGVYKAK